MKKQRSIGLVLICIVASLIVIVSAQNSMSTQTIIEAGSLQTVASYVVFRDGSTYYARNGTTGEIEFSGSVATTVIQSAIDALSSGLILFKDGSYSITTLINLDDNIEIEGESQQGVVLTATTDNPIFRINNWENISFRKLTLAQTQTNYGISIGANTQNADNFLIQDVTFRGINGSAGIGISTTTYYVNDVRVYSCSFSDLTYGIYSSGLLNGLWVSGCLFENINLFLNGIVVYNASGSSSNIWILNNKLLRPTNYPIQAVAASNVYIKNNYIEGTNAFWTSMYTSGTADMIDLSNVTEFEISGNSLYQAGDMGITIRDGSQRGIVSGNKVWRADCRGINLADVTQLITDVIISDNVCWENGQDYSSRSPVDKGGIVLKGAVNCTLTGNICYDEQGTPTQDYGIREANGAANSDYNIIVSCFARLYGTAGISIVGSNTKVNLCYNGTSWIS